MGPDGGPRGSPDDPPERSARPRPHALLGDGAGQGVVEGALHGARAEGGANTHGSGAPDCGLSGSLLVGAACNLQARGEPLGRIPRPHELNAWGQPLCLCPALPPSSESRVSLVVGLRAVRRGGASGVYPRNWTPAPSAAFSMAERRLSSRSVGK